MLAGEENFPFRVSVLLEYLHAANLSTSFGRETPRTACKEKSKVAVIYGNKKYSSLIIKKDTSASPNYPCVCHF